MLCYCFPFVDELNGLGECSEDYEYLHQCSGVIVSCDQDGYGGYHIDVVTAAMLLANSDAEPPVLAPDLKVCFQIPALPTHSTCLGSWSWYPTPYKNI